MELGLLKRGVRLPANADIARALELYELVHRPSQGRVKFRPTDSTHLRGNGRPDFSQTVLDESKGLEDCRRRVGAEGLQPAARPER